MSLRSLRFISGFPALVRVQPIIIAILRYTLNVSSVPEVPVLPGIDATFISGPPAGGPPPTLLSLVHLLVRHQADRFFVGQTAKPAFFRIAPNVQYFVSPEGMKPPGTDPRMRGQRGIVRYSVYSHNVYLLVGVVHQVCLANAARPTTAPCCSK